MRITIGHLRRIIREVVEGLGSPTDEEKNKVFLDYSGEHNDVWEDFMREYFMDMAAGGRAHGLKDEHFPNWTSDDFYEIIDRIDRVHGYI